MIKVDKKIILVLLLAITAGGFLLPNLVHADNDVIYSTPAKDSDLDGLTDQGELQIFGTNPSDSDTDRDGYLDGAEVLSGTNPLDSNSPVQTAKEARINQISTQVIETKEVPWPWYFSRASGIVAYLLLFFLIISGIGIKTTASYRLISPTTAWITHRYLGITLAFSIFVHIISLLFDDFLQFTLLELLIPFESHFESTYVALGIVGFYIFLAIIITSLFFMQKIPRTWRALHYLTYPTFGLIFLHGVLIGTDTSTPIMQAVYWSTGIIASIMILYRIFISYKLRKK
ncbi:ferric reductase-like transmembrane domain-containing protein [candidate division KSB1 bacterium]